MFNISIHDKASLDQFVRSLAPHTNIPATRIKTAIAKAFDYKHIGALEAALSAGKTQDGSTSGTISAPDAYIIEQLVLWLEDNVDQGTSIAFDNNDEVFSEHALGALKKLIESKSVSDNSKEKSVVLEKISSYDAETSVLALAEVSNISELNMQHWEQAEDTVTDVAFNITNHPQFSALILAAQAANLKGISSALLDLHNASKNLVFLKEVV